MPSTGEQRAFRPEGPDRRPVRNRHRFSVRLALAQARAFQTPWTWPIIMPPVLSMQGVSINRSFIFCRPWRRFLWNGIYPSQGHPCGQTCGGPPGEAPVYYFSCRSEVLHEAPKRRRRFGCPIDWRLTWLLWRPPGRGTWMLGLRRLRQKEVKSDVPSSADRW